MFRSHIVEISGKAPIPMFSENLFKEFIRDLKSPFEFSSRKVNLFDSSMSRLDLPHRFKHFWQTPTTLTDNSYALRRTVPPSEAWWLENVYFVTVAMSARYSFGPATIQCDAFGPLIRRFCCPRRRMIRDYRYQFRPKGIASIPSDVPCSTVTSHTTITSQKWVGSRSTSWGMEGRQQEQDQWDQSYIGYKRVMISCV